MRIATAGRWQKKRWFALVGAVAVAGISSGASAQTPKPTLADSTRVNADSAEGRWHGMPTVAVDPANPKHVIVTTRHQQADSTVDCEVHTSYDAMASFKHAVIPAPHTCARYNTRGRVHAAIGGESRAYLLVGDTGKTTLVPSTDGGLTFNEPVEVEAANGDFNRMAVRRTPGAPDTVYVVRRGTSAVNNARVATVSVSTDNGASFAPSVEVSDLDKVLSGNENIHVEAGSEPGRVYVLYTDARPTPAGAPPGFPGFPGRMFFSTSSDNGATWGERSSLVDTGIDAAPSLDQNNYWTDLAVSPKTGAVFILWSDERNGVGNADIFLLRSLDGGATWAPIQQLTSDAAGAERIQNRGSISIAPNGRVDVAYYDYEDTCAPDPLQCLDAKIVLRSSADGGATFGDPERLTSTPFDFRNRRGTWANGDKQEVSTSVASADELAYAAWVDTRLGTPDVNNRDIAASRAQFSAFIRLLPPPEFVVVAVVETITPPAPAPIQRPAPPPILQAAAPPPPPPPPPAAPPPAPAPVPIPAAAPITPVQPPPMLGAQFSGQIVSVGAVVPTPDVTAANAPQARWQEATAPSGNGQIFFFASASLVTLAALALSMAALTRLTPDARPVPARNRNS